MHKKKSQKYGLTCSASNLYSMTEKEVIHSGISVVIPVYNGEATISELVMRLDRILPALSEQYEVILVNDGSPDQSWSDITRLAAEYPRVRGINLMRNYGQHNATLCGIRAAQFDVIVTMDDDLQHLPEEIHKLLDKLAEGFDVVYGVPRKMPHTWWRNLFSYLIKRAMALVIRAKNVHDFAAFRAFRISLREAFCNYQNPNVLVDALLSWGTTRFATVQVEELPRPYGRSNYSFAKLFEYTMVVLTGFSTLPLRVTSMLGFVFTIMGVLLFLYVVSIYFIAGSVPGFPFLASVISIFSGVQLFALGMMGEYLARIFDRSMDRPPYVIGATVDSKPGDASSPTEAGAGDR
jgi:glycosyltransferase involved in cell wall biosynthesis